MLTMQSAQVVELVLLAFTNCSLKIRGEELRTCWVLILSNLTLLMVKALVAKEKRVKEESQSMH
jgi:hypothetical protein